MKKAAQNEVNCRTTVLCSTGIWSLCYESFVCLPIFLFSWVFQWLPHSLIYASSWHVQRILAVLLLVFKFSLLLNLCYNFSLCFFRTTHWMMVYFYKTWSMLFPISVSAHRYLQSSHSLINCYAECCTSEQRNITAFFILEDSCKAGSWVLWSIILLKRFPQD